MMTSEDHTLMPKGNGWHMPPASRKYHYFEDTRSLCSKYGFMNAQGTKDSGEYADDDCAKCVRALKKRAEKKKDEADQTG